MRKLWYRVAVWFGLRYNIWPWWWYDANDVTWTSVGQSEGGWVPDDTLGTPGYHYYPPEESP